MNQSKLIQQEGQSPVVEIKIATIISDPDQLRVLSIECLRAASLAEAAVRGMSREELDRRLALYDGTVLAPQES